MAEQANSAADSGAPCAVSAAGPQAIDPVRAAVRTELPYWRLYSMADGLDLLLMALGLLGSLAAAMMAPLSGVFVGDLTNVCGAAALKMALAQNLPPGTTFEHYVAQLQANASALGVAPEALSADILQEAKTVALKFLGLAVLALVAIFLEVSMFMISGLRQTARLRRRVLASVLRQDMTFFDLQKTQGALTSLLTDDCAAVQAAISEKVPFLIHYFGTFVASFALSFTYSWDVCLLLIGCIPFMGLSGNLIGRATTMNQNAQQSAYAEANELSMQALMNIRTVTAFNGQQATLASYEKSLRGQEKKNTLASALLGLAFSGLMFSFFCSFALVFFYASYRVANGVYSGGDITAVVIATFQGGYALGQVAPILPFITRGRLAGARLFRLIDQQPDLHDVEHSLAGSSSEEHGGAARAGSNAAAEEPGDSDSQVSVPMAAHQGTGELQEQELKGQLTFEHVCFAYPTLPDLPVLRGLCLSISAGRTTAIVGRSGGGKSTILQLIQRLYDPEAGRVLLDGVDIRSLRIRWLRQQMSIVLQEPTLFAATIRENIILGRVGATEEEVVAAAQAANAMKFLQALPQGLDTFVGERGVQLSGGQKQRIAIARAILRQPKILLLDEATSALDTRSERIVQAALLRVSVGRTTVVVAHRLSTIKSADSIAVMGAEGRVLEQGTHEQLLADPSGVYTSLVLSQEARGPGSPTPRDTACDDPGLEEEEVEEDAQELHRPVITHLFATVTSLDDSEHKFYTDSSEVGKGLRGTGSMGSVGADVQHGAAGSGASGAGGGAGGGVTMRSAAEVADASPAAAVQPEEVDMTWDDDPERESKPVVTADTVELSDEEQAALDVAAPSSMVKSFAGTMAMAVTAASTKGLGGAFTSTTTRGPPAPAVTAAELTNEEQAALDVAAAAQVPMSRLLAFNKPEWLAGLVGCIASAVCGMVQPVYAYLLAKCAMDLFHPDPGEIKRRERFNAGMFFVLGVGILLSVGLQHLLLGHCAQHLTRRVRAALLGSLLKREMAFFDEKRHSPSRLANTLATQAAHVRGAVGDFASLLIVNLAGLALAFVMCAVFDWELTLVLSGSIPLMLIGMQLQAKSAATTGVFSGSLAAAADALVTESLNAIRVVKAYGLEEHIQGSYGALREPGETAATRSTNMNAAGCGFSYFALWGTMALAAFFGGWQVQEGHRMGDEVMHCIAILTVGLLGLAFASVAFPDLGKAKAAVGQVFTLMDQGHTIAEEGDERALEKQQQPVDGEILFQDVFFVYPSRPSIPILRDFNLHVSTGETHALVGESGSGKSTIVQLLLRFYEPVGGRVLLDGVPVEAYNLKWLRSQFGLVSQEPCLFKGSVAENVRYGKPDASMEEVEAAARLAYAHEFIMALPQGYDTLVGQGGVVQLSGGQKQRLAIARALIRQPKILLLDEATSALDNTAERTVQEAINQACVGRTTIVIAHRLSTIRDAHTIHVLVKGVIVEQGGHEQLMARGPTGVYAGLVHAQDISAGSSS